MSAETNSCLTVWLVLWKQCWLNCLLWKISRKDPYWSILSVAILLVSSSKVEISWHENGLLTSVYCQTRHGFLHKNTYLWYLVTHLFKLIWEWNGNFKINHLTSHLMVHQDSNQYLHFITANYLQHKVRVIHVSGKETRAYDIHCYKVNLFVRPRPLVPKIYPFIRYIWTHFNLKPFTVCMTFNLKPFIVCMTFQVFLFEELYHRNQAMPW